MSDDDEIVTIPKLDVDEIAPHRDEQKRQDGGVYLIIGASGSGKSRIIKSLAFAKKDFIPLAIVVSETEEINNAYKAHVPALFIYNKNNADIIPRVQTRQVLAKQQLENPWATLILDDCMNKKANFREEAQIALFKTSRHYKLFVLISCQYSFDLKPDLREQCAGFFILRSDNETNRDKIYKNYASIIPNQRLFNMLMDTLTGDYGALFIDNRCSTNNWREKIKWYRAADLSQYGDWQLTSLDVQAYNKDRFDEQYDSILSQLARTRTL